MFDYLLALALITLAAAVVNGALGYGFSSITVPLALLFLTSRTLNPALVLIEVGLNAYVLWVNRAALASIWRRVLPIVVGLAPHKRLLEILKCEISTGILASSPIFMLSSIALTTSSPSSRICVA